MNEKDRESCQAHEQDRINHPFMEYYRYVFQDSERWDGTQNLEGKTVLVYMEQGLGDCIQFLRYLTPLRREKKCKVIVCAPKELKRLIVEAGVGGWDNFHVKDNPDLPDHDYHALSMSLPFLLSEELATRGLAHTTFPYISPQKFKDLSDVPGCFAPNAHRIGLVWEGSPSNPSNVYRSIPLVYFSKIEQFWANRPANDSKSDKQLKLFCLQKEMHNSDLLIGAENMELFGVDIQDFLDTAELIKSLDLVITIDTSVLHLAGAMNKSCIGLITSAQDGRYGASGAKTRWYPSVHLIRNERPLMVPMSWTDTFDKLVEVLPDYL